MIRLTAKAGTIPLVTGLAAATVLSGSALFAVVRSGCDDPGRYEERGGVVELIGGCVSAEDLPVSPEIPTDPDTRPLGDGHLPNRY